MRRSAALLPLLLVSGCLVGPDYERAPPASAVAPQYKEAELPPGTASLFRPAQPSDGADRGHWWRVYGDPTLDGAGQRMGPDWPQFRPIPVHATATRHHRRQVLLQNHQNNAPHQDRSAFPCLCIVLYCESAKSLKTQ